MLKIYFIYLVFVISAQISNSIFHMQNRMNLLSFTNTYSSSLFPVLQWCSLIKLYTLFPSKAQKKNFITGSILELDYFYSRNIEKIPQESLISDKDNILISKMMENAISEYLINHNFDDLSTNSKTIQSSFKYKDLFKESKKVISRSLSDSNFDENFFKCTPELSFYIEILLYKLRKNKEGSRLFGILMNRIHSSLEIMKIPLFTNHIDNIVDFFNFAARNPLRIDMNQFFKFYFKYKKKSTDFVNNKDSQCKIDDYSFYKAILDKHIHQNNLMNVSKINNGDNFVIRKNNGLNSSQNMILDKEKDYISVLTGYFDALFFIFNSIFDYALNENTIIGYEDSLVCLELFSDCNLLIHLSILLLNPKSSNEFKYFLFNMEGSANQILECFRNFDYSTKVHFLLDTTKTFQKLKVNKNEIFRSYRCKSSHLLRSSDFIIFLSDSPVALELHSNISKRIFFENLANALFLAVINPISWEPPHLRE